MVSREDLFDLEDPVIGKLKRTIASLRLKVDEFKKYDEKRKNYYKKSLIRLGECESYILELEDGTAIEKLKALNKQYKGEITRCNRRIFLDKILELSDTELEIGSHNATLQIKLNTMETEIKKLKDANNYLIMKLNT